MLAVSLVVSTLAKQMQRAMSDLVPSFFYYHASLVVRSLAEQLKKDGQQTPHVWCEYNRLRRLVDEANGLFGVSMTLSHVLKLFLACAMIYTLLHRLSSSADVADAMLVLSGVYSLFVGHELVSSVLLTSNLKRQVAQLRAVVSDLGAAAAGSELSAEQRATLAAFADELRGHRLHVRPCDLYNVEPNLLLSVLGLVTTYVIILLQSK